MGSGARGADSLVERREGLRKLTGLRAIGPWLGVLCLAIAAQSALEAQNVRATVNHPAGLTRLLVDVPALIQTNTSGTATYAYQPAGRFQLLTGPRVADGGNPFVAGDENRPIASLESATGTWNVNEFSSKLTVSVDGVRFDPFEQMFEQTPDADPADLPIFWVQDLMTGTRDAVGEVLLPLQSDVPTAGEPNIRVRVSYQLVHDGLMIEHIVYNEDAVAHNIGLRVLIDALFGTSARDGSAIILDDGTTINNEVIIPDPNNPGVALPATWVTYDDPTNPLVALRGTVVGSEVTDPGIASESGGVPDQLQFGQYRNLGNPLQFDFQPNSRASLLGEDWAYAVRWDERVLQPGKSRRYVTYYGLGAAAVDYDPPYALAAYAPAQLEVVQGDDPLTPEIEQYYLVEQGGDSVFEIIAAIDNFGTSPLTNASVRVSLPEGLELYPATQPHTISLGVVNRNQAPLPAARWRVRASATRPGTAVIRITGPLGKVVERQISIPAVPIIPARPSLVGLEMLSVPYQFLNSDASNVFGSLSDSVFPGGPVALWRWHPETAQYLTYPDPFVANIEPGEGLWLLNQNRETIVLPPDAQPVPDTETFMLPLSPGWNLIGGPHVIPIRFDQVRVLDPEGLEWSITEASQRGLILPVLYAYDAENNEYTWSTSLPNTMLVPFEGYWLLVYRPITLVFPVPSLYSPAEVTRVASAPTPADGWQVGLIVECGGRTRAPRYFGVGGAASAGVDTADVPAPPSLLSPGPALDAYFAIGDDTHGLRYLVDTQDAGAGTWTFDLTVLAEAPGAPVTIRWPGLAETLPSDLVATLQDVDGGRSTYMRTSASYTFNSGTGGERHFRITVRPRAAVTLGLGAAARPVAGGGLEICYTLSADAVVNVEIRNIAGRVVRRLAEDRAAVSGQNTLVWNGLSNAGTAVPAGTYIIQVTARSPETGEQASVIRTATISR